MAAKKLQIATTQNVNRASAQATRQAITAQRQAANQARRAAEVTAQEQRKAARQDTRNNRKLARIEAKNPGPYNGNGSATTLSVDPNLPSAAFDSSGGIIGGTDPGLSGILPDASSAAGNATAATTGTTNFTLIIIGVAGIGILAYFLHRKPA